MIYFQFKNQKSQLKDWKRQIQSKINLYWLYWLNSKNYIFDLFWSISNFFFVILYFKCWIILGQINTKLATSVSACWSTAIGPIFLYIVIVPLILDQHLCQMAERTWQIAVFWAPGPRPTSPCQRKKLGHHFLPK